MEEMKKDLFDLKHQERFSKEKNLCPENCSWPGWEVIYREGTACAKALSRKEGVRGKKEGHWGRV